ncbi:MAG: hypothetical protein JWM56_1414 [Candidatus Peribacteria bacterium]|nr:hypothetical protein [Candidatus Peribacteria bacterium]
MPRMYSPDLSIPEHCRPPAGYEGNIDIIALKHPNGIENLLMVPSEHSGEFISHFRYPQYVFMNASADLYDRIFIYRQRLKEIGFENVTAEVVAEYL